MPKITFFKSQSEWHQFLKKNHDKIPEQWVGFHKKDSGKPSITYQQALDEALCYGWIDGIRKNVNPTSYTIRFTPRRPKSIWSAVNITRATELKKSGLMQPSGLREFEGRDPTRANKYSFEQASAKLNGSLEKKFKANKKAWKFFLAQPPGYKKIISWWIISAKKEETRLKRLDIAMRTSAKGRRIDFMKPAKQM